MAEPTNRTSSPLINSPFILVPILMVIAMFFATLMWFGARRETAALYGFIRSVEFPFISKWAPHAEHFQMERLQEGIVPAFTMIYQNSFVYGLFFTMLTLLLMMLALVRLDKFSILSHITIKKDTGRTHKEVMERLARDEPSVRFFLDYDVMALPTTEGTARQAMRAMELLLYTDTINHVKIDPKQRVKPDLDIKEEVLRRWMVERFGPQNPFIDITQRRLLDVTQIKEAVDELSWYSVLVLYPALYRIHAFYVEETGFESATDEIEGFIDGIWEELNGFKREFRDGIELGFASDADREERNALYRAHKAQPKKKRRKKKNAAAEAEIEIEASTILDNLTDLARTFRRGRIDRGEIPSEGTVERSEAGPRTQKKAKAPEHLLFFGEVLSERGPNLKSVETARAGLKDILTRHLGQFTKVYPIETDPDTGKVVYAPKITTAEQKAFNTKAQERLATGVRAMEKVLFNHQFEFSACGGALEVTRQYGIMPPNLFRWMRFCDETTAFWWFVHNLGLPAAVPENAGHFEHYQAERAMGVAVEQPHINASLTGIREEAARYLVPETIDELKTILGKDAIASSIVDADAVTQVMGDFDRILREAAEAVTEPKTGAQRLRTGKARNRPTNQSTESDNDAPAKVASQGSILDEFNLDDED